MAGLRLAVGLLWVVVLGCNLLGDPPPLHQSSDEVSKIDACSLATREEVEAIQGAKMLDPSSSEGPEVNFLLSQCYYGSAEPDKSVSLGVMQRNPADAGTRTITQFWHETFGRFVGAENAEAAEKKQQGGEGEDQKEREGARPQKIEGLGQESYWLGNPMGGILYVLKNDRMLRISFGGPGSGNDKLAKSKALAEKAVNRL